MTTIGGQNNQIHDDIKLAMFRDQAGSRNSNKLPGGVDEDTFSRKDDQESIQEQMN
jgi:hypothetical protein